MTSGPPAGALRGNARLAAPAVVVLAFVLAIIVGACGEPDRAAAGIVVAVDSAGGQVTGFTLRTQAGDALVFVVGTLEIDGAAFPASHLVEHAVTLQPIAVGYRVVDGRNVVHRMVDAPWAGPSP